MRAALLLPALILAALLGGCILTEEVPADPFGAVVDDAFAARCADDGHDRAVGCVLACGVGASPVLGIEGGLLGYVGAGVTFAPGGDGRFDARRGTAHWQECTANAYGGLACRERTAPYTVRCVTDGVAVQGEDGAPRPTVPAEVVETSVLPSMMAGRFRGEPGSCLAECIAVVSRPACGACAEGEGCLETGFGDACHPPGATATGGTCRGHQDCRSLRCNPREARCE